MCVYIYIYMYIYIYIYTHIHTCILQSEAFLYMGSPIFARWAEDIPAPLVI